MRTPILLLASLAGLAALALSGCFGGDDTFDPNRDFKETGRTIRLKATVVDLVEHEVYPGFKANLWAFCIEPLDPNDDISAAAVEYRDPLPTDGTIGAGGPQRKECGVPGPTIRVTQGDRVIVEFSHSHFHPHTIHWHGQFVPWESDGAPGVTQDSIVAGDAITYDFIAKRAGTLWYHCHVDTQFHVMRGLYGAFIVEPQDKSLEPKDVDKEYTLILGTLTRGLVEAVPGRGIHSHPGGCASGFPDCMNPEWDVTPDTFVINGHSYPYTMQDPSARIEVSEGERIRLRIINVGESFETMHPHGHDMLVTHRDGNPLQKEARFWVDTLTIGPAERYDVVIDADNPGPWMFHTHVNSHETNCGRSGGGMHTMILYDDGHGGHGFRAELPAGCPYQEPFGLASDIVRATILSPDDGLDVTATDPAFFRIDQECSVRSVSLRATLQADNPVFAGLSTVNVRVTSPNAGTIASFDLGGQGAMTGNLTIPGYQLYQDQDGLLGDYTATVAGTVVQSRVLVEAFVDHYEALGQTLEAHLLGLPNCPGVNVP